MILLFRHSQLFWSRDSSKTVAHWHEDHKFRKLLKALAAFIQIAIVPDVIQRFSSIRLRLFLNGRCPQQTTEEWRANHVWVNQRRATGGRRSERKTTDLADRGFAKMRGTVCYWDRRMRQSGWSCASRKARRRQKSVGRLLKWEAERRQQKLPYNLREMPQSRLIDFDTTSIRQRKSV